MPPKKVPDDALTQALTSSESHFIKILLDNINAKPLADWAQVAASLGLKDAKFARERFRRMCLRHGWRGEAGAVKDEVVKDGAVNDDGAVKNGRVEKRKRGPKAKKIKVEEGSEGTEGTEETESTD